MGVWSKYLFYTKLNNKYPPTLYFIAISTEITPFEVFKYTLDANDFEAIFFKNLTFIVNRRVDRKNVKICLRLAPLQYTRYAGTRGSCNSDQPAITFNFNKIPRIYVVRFVFFILICCILCFTPRRTKLIVSIYLNIIILNKTQQYL